MVPRSSNPSDPAGPTLPVSWQPRAKRQAPSARRKANHLHVDSCRCGEALLLLQALRDDAQTVRGAVAIVQLECDLQRPDEEWMVRQTRTALFPGAAQTRWCRSDPVVGGRMAGNAPMPELPPDLLSRRPGPTLGPCAPRWRRAEHRLAIARRSCGKTALRSQQPANQRRNGGAVEADVEGGGVVKHGVRLPAPLFSGRPTVPALAP